LSPLACQASMGSFQKTGHAIAPPRATGGLALGCVVMANLLQGAVGNRCFQLRRGSIQQVGREVLEGFEFLAANIGALVLFEPEHEKPPVTPVGRHERSRSAPLAAARQPHALLYRAAAQIGVDQAVPSLLSPLARLNPNNPQEDFQRFLVESYSAALSKRAVPCLLGGTCTVISPRQVSAPPLALKRTV